MKDRTATAWIDPAHDGMELHQAAAGRHRYDRHSHDEFSVILVTSGSKKLTLGRQSFSVERGQIAIVSPGQSHECEPLGGIDWSHRCWYIAPELVWDLAGISQRKGPYQPEAAIPVLDAPDLFKRLEYGHGEISRNPGSDAPDALTALAALFDRVMVGAEDPQTAFSASHARARLYRAALLEDIDAKLDLDRLARIGNVTRYQVIRDVNRVYDMSPGVFLRNLRLRRAKQMLSRGLPLQEITLDTGFADQSHFTRSFRSAFGVTPSSYRDAVRQG